MIVTENCEPLFAAFTAAGLNSKQLLQDIAGIVQNNGLQLTSDDVISWIGESTHRLLVMHQEQLKLLESTAKALNEMDIPRKLPILGYLPGGKRIHPIKAGMIATACVVSCVSCNKIIRGMGGPMRGALCPECWEAN